MLSSAGDYRFVDVSGVADLIAGRPLPVAYPSAYEPAAVRYEDYLWLLEAHHERTNITSEGDGSVVPASRALEKAPLYALCPSWLSDYDTDIPYIIAPDDGRWISPSAYFRDALKYGASYYDKKSSVWADNLVDWGLKCLPRFSPYYFSSSVSALSGEKMRAMFYTLNSMRRYAKVPYIEDLFEETRSFVYNADGDVTSERVNDYSRDGIGSPLIGYWYDSENGLYTQGRTVLTPKRLGPFPYIKSATLAVACSWEAATNHYNVKGYWLTVPLTVNYDKTVSLPSSLGEDLVSRMESLAGKPSTGYLVCWENTALMLDFDFPASIEEWGWEPAA